MGHPFMGVRGVPEAPFFLWWKYMTPKLGVQNLTFLTLLELHFLNKQHFFIFLLRHILFRKSSKTFFRNPSVTLQPSVNKNMSTTVIEIPLDDTELMPVTVPVPVPVTTVIMPRPCNPNKFPWILLIPAGMTLCFLYIASFIDLYFLNTPQQSYGKDWWMVVSPTMAIFMAIALLIAYFNICCMQSKPAWWCYLVVSMIGIITFVVTAMFGHDYCHDAIGV